jgi:parallel beta-helix repeat protein
MKKLLLLLVLLISLAHQIQATKYYISATGSDSNSGLTTLLPKQTLTAVNALILNANDTVAFKRGDGWYGTLIVNYSNVTFTTYGTGSTPTITGFTTISGWTNDGGGIWSKVIATETNSLANMVTIDGVQYGMGIEPNSTYLTYESSSTNVSITDNQLTGTPDWTGAEAVIKKNGYTLDRCLITSGNTSTLTYTNLGSANNADATGEYFFMNDLKTLDQYGEWYHNTTTGKFSMYFGAVDPTTKTVKVATLNNLCKINSSKTNATIDGLAFSGSIGHNLSFSGGSDYATVSNCTITFSGLNAIVAVGTNNLISNNTISDSNRLGVYCSGTSCSIFDNSVTNTAMIIGQGNTGSAYKGGLFIYGTLVDIQRNRIINSGYNGMFIGNATQTGLVKNNYIYNSCVYLWDQGAIYTSGIYTALTIDGNIAEKSGGSGIYLDAPSGNILAKNNIAIECLLSGLFNHQGSFNVWADNTAFNCQYGFMLSNTTTVSNTHDLSLSGNICVAKTATQIPFNYYTACPTYADAFPTLSFTNNIYARPIDDVNVIYWNTMGSGGPRTLSQWQTYSGTDLNSNDSPRPIVDVSDIEIRYNATTVAAPVTFSFSGVTLANVQHPSTVTLEPYTSMILIKNVINTGTLRPLNIKDANGNPLGRP